MGKASSWIRLFTISLAAVGVVCTSSDNSTCVWNVPQVGYYAGYANGDGTVRSLAASMEACCVNDACFAVTCNLAMTNCTVRAGVELLSSSGEVSIAQALSACTWNDPQDGYYQAYAGGDSTVRSLEGSLTACCQNSQCHGVTCSDATLANCTVRAGMQLMTSRIGEISLFEATSQCEWSEPAQGYYLLGYAKGDGTVRSLPASMQVCCQYSIDVCAGVTCDSTLTNCTVRGGSKLMLSSIETSFVQNGGGSH